LKTIAADPRHLSARLGLTLVLDTWGSAMTHQPHIHGIVPDGGLSMDGERWVSCKPALCSTLAIRNVVSSLIACPSSAP
jgi:hypothetical protein